MRNSVNEYAFPGELLAIGNGSAFSCRAEKEPLPKQRLYKTLIA